MNSMNPTHSTTDDPIRVALIIGSNREGRFGPVVAEWLLGRIRERDDIEADVVDTADLRLPTALSHSPSAEVTAELAKVRPKLAGADAFVVLTPEYNHSFPAPLKNLIDWHYTEWQAKPVAFVSYGGLSGGLRAVEHLRQVFAELHAVTVRDTVSFHNAGAHFDDEGRHKDPATPNAAAKGMLDQLEWWGRTLREAKKVRPYAG
ncbi:NADPH-dependent FMN reductase [Streptomyces sp. CA-288835]|uniref:NADPH-dependent FMN reductase n=1 Tax=Streptomyces sp. CA-288835 TaxID=3240069 RepID=UPI003D93EC3A